MIPKPQAPEVRKWKFKEVNNSMCFASRKDIENFTYTMEAVFKYSFSLQDYAQALLESNKKEGK